jgi:hypothetical protein
MALGSGTLAAASTPGWFLRPAVRSMDSLLGLPPLVPLSPGRSRPHVDPFKTSPGSVDEHDRSSGRFRPPEPVGRLGAMR